MKDKKLTKLQEDVCLRNGTEPPFKNEYWNNHEEGIYVDRISGRVLFLSHDKYDSGTGWPSFTRPADTSNVKYSTDESYGMVRTEIKSVDGTHLGHVFEDNFKDGKIGKRYCINSASLKFISKKEVLADKKYQDFWKFFK